MNEVLDKLWREGKPPFAGHVLAVDGELSPDQLVLALGETVCALRAAYFSRELRVNEDWHDHDGFINSDKSCTWDELASWTANVASIKASCSDDWMVHTLISQRASISAYDIGSSRTRVILVKPRVVLTFR